MKIEREGVEVDFVTQVTHHSQEGPHWVKLEDGVRKLYFPCYGWLEAKPTRRDVTGEISIENLGHSTHFKSKYGEHVDITPGYNFEKVKMYALPENWVEMWFPHGHAFTAWTWQFKRPCLIITKEE